MLFSLLSVGDPITALIQILILVPVILFSLSAHEAAHGYAAWKCGDPTAHNLGRITLNPKKHLDPIGALCMLVFGYGWAKPVPINTRYFRNPKKGMAISAAAGPLANLLLGVLNAILLGFVTALWNFVYHRFSAEFLLTALYWVATICRLGAFYNFLFMAFNLIPVPPFDGSRIAFAFLPQKYYFAIMRYEQYIMIGLLVGLMLVSRLFSFSPFSWLAKELTDLIEQPIRDIFWNHFFLKILVT